MMSSLRTSIFLRSPLFRPRLHPARLTPTSAHRFYAASPNDPSGDYGSGKGDPKGETPQEQGPNPSEPKEHPGPPPPKAGQQQQQGTGPQQKRTFSTAPRRPAHGKGTEGAQPKILNESPPRDGEEPEDVRRHNEDMAQRAERADYKVTDQDVEKDKVSKGFWSGHGGAAEGGKAEGGAGERK